MLFRSTLTFTRAGLVAFAVLYVLTGLGITAGAHRLFTHRTFTPSRPLREALALLFLLAAQGSIARWVRDHQVHHRHSDGPGDPHSPTDGFWHAHLGWLWGRPPRDEARALYARWTRDLDAGHVGRLFAGGAPLAALHLGFAIALYLLGALLEAGFAANAPLAGWHTGLSLVVWEIGRAHV